MLRTGFIGAGMTGTALAVRLADRGWPVIAVSSRKPASARRLAASVPGCRAYDTSQEVLDSTDLIFITTPDDAIERVCSELDWHSGRSVVHCSGAHSVDILAHAAQQGAAVGSFHPLQTFASVEQAVQNLPGSTFGLEAEGPLLSTLRELTALLDGTPVLLGPGDKVLYHAAAVLASNYMVTQVKLALDLWREFGVSPEEATGALLPLLQGTLNNIRTVGLPGCLTGPIARGDLDTIERHLVALQDRNPSLLAVYRELGLHTVPIALARGRIDEEKAEAMKALLSGRGSGADRHSRRVRLASNPSGNGGPGRARRKALSMTRKQ